MRDDLCVESSSSKHAEADGLELLKVVVGIDGLLKVGIEVVLDALSAANLHRCMRDAAASH